MALQLTAIPAALQPGELLELTVTGLNIKQFNAAFWDSGGLGTFEAGPSTVLKIDTDTGNSVAITNVFSVRWSADAVPPNTEVTFTVWPQAGTARVSNAALQNLTIPPLAERNAVDPPLPSATATVQVRVAEPIPHPVTLTRTRVDPTNDQTLWIVIRESTERLSFKRYKAFMDSVLCPPNSQSGLTQDAKDTAGLLGRRSLPFADVDAYRVLKVATEVFLRSHCGVFNTASSGLPFEIDPGEEALRLYRTPDQAAISATWTGFLEPVDGFATLPYLALVRQNLDDVDIDIAVDDSKAKANPELVRICNAIIRAQLQNPCFLELIWSYWHEEGMLVQTMNALAWRFQNRRGPADRDPLAMLEIDPLRPLSNLIWGYIQDEQHRLTVPRRAYEYDHHYGITLLGKAVPRVIGADTRSRFIETFHNLLYLCSTFFKEDDDTTVVADGFPILNALKAVHLLLTQGAHNQYGDLPWTSRHEMLMEQWILARPEFRNFLPRRIMVDYPEPWMQSVESMKTLQGWTDTPIIHFWDLARFGERILLSARFARWTDRIHPEEAANWARYWRAEIQGYIHAYFTVTGVDLTDQPDPTMPAVLLTQRLPQRAVHTAPQRPGRQPLSPGRKRQLPPAAAQPASAELAEWQESQ
jgi:hypothetical protein